MGEIQPRDRLYAELRQLATNNHWVALYALLTAAEALDLVQLGLVLDAALTAADDVENTARTHLELLLQERFGRR